MIEALQRRAKAGELHLLLASVQSIATGLSGQLLVAISGPLVARLLGMAGRGYLAGLNVWPAILLALGSLSLPSAVTYYLSRRPSEGRQIVAETYRIVVVQTVGLSGLLFAVLYFWSRGKPDDVQIAIYPTLLMIIAGLTQAYAVAILQGRHRFTACNILRELPAAFYAASIVVLFILGENRLLVVQSAWVAAYGSSALISMLVALRELRPDWNPAPALRRELVAFGLRGYLGSVAPINNLPVDQAVVALVFSPATLGLYAVAYAFTNVPLFVAQSAGIVSYPAIAAQQGTPAARRLLWTFFWGVSLLNAAGAFVLILLLPLLVHFFFGPAFAGAVPIARILLAGTTVAASRRLLMDGMRGLGRPGASTIIEASMYPWLLIGAPILTLRYGVLGLAGSLGIGYGISLVVAAWFTVRTTRRLGAARPAAARRWLPSLYDSRIAQRLLGRPESWLHALLFMGVASGLGTLVVVLPSALVLALAVAFVGGVVLLLARRLLAGAATKRPIAPATDEAMPGGLRFPRLLYYFGTFFLAWLTFRPLLSTTLSDWFFLASLLATCAELLITRRRAGLEGLRPIWAGIVLFSVGALVSTFGADSPLQSLSALARFAYLVVVWLWLGTVLLRTLSQLKTVILLWVISAATSGGIAVVQLLFGNIVPGSSIAWGRMTGFATQVNDLGGTVCVALIPALMILTYARTGRRTRFLAGGAVLFILAGLMLSGSVGGLLAAAAAFVLWAVADRLQVRLLALVLVLGIAGFVVISLQQSSGAVSPLARVSQVANPDDPANATLFSRLDTYRAAWDGIQNNPLIGAGLDPNSARAGTQYRVHDVFLGAWYEAGILGVLGVVVLLVSIGLAGRSTILRASAGEERLIALALLVAFVAFVVYLLGEPFLYERYGWISAALLLVLRAQQQRRRSAAAAPPEAVPDRVSVLAPLPAVSVTAKGR